MRRRRRGLASAVQALVLVVLAGCVYYPTVTDVGGIRIQPANGRVVRQGADAEFFADIDSTGKYDDAITRVETPIAKQAQIVDRDGAAISRLAVPGTTLVRLQPGAPHVRLSGLTRELKPGEVVIVTLFFEKTGAIGVIAPVE